MENGDVDMAYRLYTQCLELDDTASVLSAREKAIILGNRSSASFKKQEYHSALKDATGAVKTDNLYAKVSPCNPLQIFDLQKMLTSLPTYYFETFFFFF